LHWRAYNTHAAPEPLNLIHPITMTHKTISIALESAGFIITRVPATGHHAYDATHPGKPGVRAYWHTSDLGGMLGKPRIVRDGVDTHARSEKELISLAV